MSITDRVSAASFIGVTFATFAIAHAQPDLGRISGTVTAFDGTIVANAPIRATGGQSDTDARTFSAEDGSYTIDGLASGTYVVTIVTNCCTYARYTSGELAIDDGQSIDLDIRLEEGFTLGVVGDDPGLKNDELRARQRIPELPVPRAADGRPDLQGVWLPRDDPFPEPARALPWASAISQERISNQLRDLPGMRCLPNNIPPFYAGASRMSKFVQTPNLLVVLFEESPGFRQIFLDGREHPDNANPGWVGHSIGRWEDDVLVVDTVGFNSRGWTFTYPRTEMLHIEERYERIEYGRMKVRVTIEDPGVFSEPLVREMTWDLAPQEEIFEYVCENNKWADTVEELGSN